MWGERSRKIPVVIFLWQTNTSLGQTYLTRPILVQDHVELRTVCIPRQTILIDWSWNCSCWYDAFCTQTSIGYNICNATTQNQDSMCQTSFLNSIDDKSCHLYNPVASHQPNKTWSPRFWRADSYPLSLPLLYSCAYGEVPSQTKLWRTSRNLWSHSVQRRSLAHACWRRGLYKGFKCMYSTMHASIYRSSLIRSVGNVILQHPNPWLHRSHRVHRSDRTQLDTRWFWRRRRSTRRRPERKPPWLIDVFQRI